MLLSSVLITGSVTAAGVKAYQKYKEQKKKKETPWTYVAEKIGVLKHKKRSSFFLPFRDALQTDSVRKQQQLEISNSAESTNISEAEKEANYYIGLSGLSLAFATGASVYPALNLVTLPILCYMSFPVLRYSYENFFKLKRRGTALVDSIMIGGLLIAGYYFATSLAFLLYYSSRKLLLKTEDHSKSSLINIFGQQPRSVWIQKTLPSDSASIEVEIPFEDIQIGDIAVIHAGQTIPVDGTVTSGQAGVDQRALTGESQPVDVGDGAQVFAGTVVLSGRICIRVEKAGTDTVAAQIGEILNHTDDFKSSVQSRGEKIVDQGALPTLAFAALAYPLLGPASAIATLSACVGYQMRLTAPISVLNFMRITSENGLLIKDGRSLELLSQIDTVVFDKTGTLTEEIPTVGQIISLNEYSEDELLRACAAAEYKQTHPIALAITQEAKKRELTLPEIHDAKYEVGYGLKVFLTTQNKQEEMVRVGSARFMAQESITIPAHIKKIEESCHEEGHSLIYVAIGNHLSGVIELVPTIRPEAKQITSELRKRHIGMVIISGDHQKPTQKLAQSLGIDNYFAEVLPQDKASLIEQLQQEGKSVCFVGDGINDSIALKKANVGISLSGASTAATDTAGIILMDGSLKKFIRLLDIANDLSSNLKRSTVMSIIPGAICIGGIFFIHWGILSAIMLYNIGLVTSISNAMLPLIKYQNSNSTSK